MDQMELRLKAAKHRFSTYAAQVLKGQDPEAGNKAYAAWLECKRIMEDLKARDEQEDKR